jgi:glycosyltransferase involved in cell wall biosynthesis
VTKPEPVLLTVVMPAFNEEGAIAAAVADVQRQVLSHVAGAELVIVNDGSRDATGAILDRLAADDSRLRVIHQPNGGHGRALRAGLDAARGEYVLLLDSDRQIPLERFDQFWRLARGRDAVLGVRAGRRDPWPRLVLTRAVRLALWLLFDVRLRDANAPCKSVRREVWLHAAAAIPPDSLAPSLMLAIFLRRAGYAVVEFPVAHRPRDTGEVSLRAGKLFRFCLRGLGQLLAFREGMSQWARNRRSASSAPDRPASARPGASTSGATAPGGSWKRARRPAA